MNASTRRLAAWLTPVLALLATAALAQTPPLVVRHSHYFVVVNPGPTAPVLTLTSRAFYTYADTLAATVSDPDGAVRLDLQVLLGTSWRGAIPGPVAPLYLVTARPGMNGVIFGADRPWGVVANGAGLGSNGPVPVLYLYVPPECAAFTVTCAAASLNEGARLTVCQPDGTAALVLDGEFDRPETREITGPAPARGQVWSLAWAAPQSVKAALDDVETTITGPLAPLLWPEREWAASHGPMVWARQREATARQ